MGDVRADVRPERQDRGERPERPARPERPPFRERSQYGEPRRGFRDRRFQRQEASDEPAPGLPSFITAPPARVAAGETEPTETGFAPVERAQPREHEGVNFHLSSRRRRRPRPQLEESGGEMRDEASQTSELPFEPDRF